MKPCRKCGSDNLKMDSSGTFDGWSGWITCRNCGHCVATCACKTWTRAEEFAKKLWELDN